jgi:hypothetical protein
MLKRKKFSEKNVLSKSKNTKTLQLNSLYTVSQGFCEFFYYWPLLRTFVFYSLKQGIRERHIECNYGFRCEQNFQYLPSWRQYENIILTFPSKSVVHSFLSKVKQIN